MKAKLLPKLSKCAEMDFHKLLRGIWIKLILVIAPTSIIAIFILSSALYESAFLEICPHVFTGTITVMGVIVGLVPLISYFYVERVRGQEQKIAKDWRGIRDELRKEFKKEDEELFAKTTNLILKSYYNLEMGVLKYTEEFTTTSILAFLLMIFVYAILMGTPVLNLNIAAFLTILVNIISLEIIVSGIPPLLRIAASPPARELVSPFILKDVQDALECV